jgi:cell fate regulator YaaT (PSP1 superfamily)
MACSSCSVGRPADGESSGGGCSTAGGCKGSCSSGGCTRLNTFDWITFQGIQDSELFDLIEVSFKNGSRKDFFHTNSSAHVTTGDMVVVETDNGYDIGRITLMGELVRLQLKKKRIHEDRIFREVLRRANERDLEKLMEARDAEQITMVRARAISRTLGLDMKIGDVEYQGDKRKATFYYTADGRVDFRELIRHFAQEFKIKVEMRQIGARQESARIGGIGACGRELCCSTWLTDFRSVSTVAARYQNLAINQAKLSGQCGRLKCCLNYELDTYAEAIKEFPEDADKLRVKDGMASLMKIDVFKGLMYYFILENNRAKIYALDLARVKEVQKLNATGNYPDKLGGKEAVNSADDDADKLPNVEFGDVTGAIELPMDDKKRKKKRDNSNEPPANNARQERYPRNDRPQQRPERGENSRQERPDRAPRPERNDAPRQERPDRAPRPERNDAPRQERTDRAPRPERNDQVRQERLPRPERTDFPPRQERQERPPRPERTDFPPRPEGQERPERNDQVRQERPPRPERTDFPPRQERQERPPRPERTEQPRQERPERTDFPRQERPERPPRPERTEQPRPERTEPRPERTEQHPMERNDSEVRIRPIEKRPKPAQNNDPRNPDFQQRKPFNKKNEE